MNPIYLDYNATTPVDPMVINVMESIGKQYFGNPSSSHSYGLKARQVIEDARNNIAAMLHAGAGELVFTSGGTESNNMAIKGVVFANIGKGNHIIISSVEHPAVREVCEWLLRFGCRLTILPVDGLGMVDPDEVKRAITPSTILVSVMHANNEVGTLQPVAEIGLITRERGVIFHTDAAQSVGKVLVDVEDLHVDLLSVAGHKWYAPKGVGALFIRQGTRLEKFMHGADHEGNQRAGTENIIHIAGLGKAADLIRFNKQGHPIPGKGQEEMHELKNLLWNNLADRIPEICLNGHPTICLPNTLSVGFPGTDATRLLRAMPRIAASAGAACHADREEISPVLQAMNVPRRYAIGTVRFSTGRMTTSDEIMEACEFIVKAFHKVVRVKTGGVAMDSAGANLTLTEPDKPFPFIGSFPVVEKQPDKQGVEPVDVKLTAYTHALGCACKIRPQFLERILRKLPLSRDKAVLVGFETSDDAAVYAISGEQAIVQTVDVIPPVVDDPYMFGAIAAANAISDVYAMGGNPAFALSIIGFPDKELNPEVLEKILAGVHDKVTEAGIEIIGGHTIENDEPLTGLVVTGLIDPKQILRNQGASAGDYLILTKPLGTGVIMTALKHGIARPGDVKNVMESMALLNKGARDVMVNLPVNACTDITGFGLLGHLKEMIRGTEVSVLLDRASIPVFTGAFDYMQAGMVPGGTKNNLDFVADSVEWDDRIDERSRLILCDAQTSGGLLIALPEQFTSTFKENLKQLHGLDSFVIARVIKGQGKIFVQ